MRQDSKFQISSAGLHILAMAFMLCDHTWATILPAQEWLNCVGRLAFPIFAFLLAEGCRRTHNRRRYLQRLLVWAVLSEIPFNLMCGGSAFYPLRQNVLWTFFISLLFISLIDKCQARFPAILAWVLTAVLAFLGFLLGYLTMVDYYGVGVLTVLVFYLFSKRNWVCFLGQLACLYYLNVELLGGYYYAVRLFGHEVALYQQGLALLALLPIWLYRGKQGLHTRGFRLFCYAFYPLHISVLLIIRAWMLR